MRIATIFLMLGTSACIGPVELSQRPPRDVYYGLTIVDPVRETFQPNSYIAVERGKIVKIGRGRPGATPRARLHDLSGSFAMPGLVDTHAHVTLGPVRVEKVAGKARMVADHRPDIVAYSARNLLSFGITTIRNPAGDMAANRAYSNAVSAGTIIGPDAVHAAEVIDRIPIPFDGLVTRVSADLPIADIVRRQAEQGASFIKLYTSLTEADLAAGINAAHAHNLPAIAHLRDVSWTRAAELGVDVLLHMMPISPDLLPAERREQYRRNRRAGGFEFFEWYEAADLDDPAIRHMVSTLAREKVEVNPTLVAFEPAFWGDRLHTLELDLGLAHPDMRAKWNEGLRFDTGWKAEDYKRARSVWPKLLELTRRLYEAGVPMTIGTDLSNPFVPPGSSMAREMVHHQTAGIPTWAVLRLATSDGARLSGVGNRTGKLRVGLEADILVLHKNPVADLSTIRDVRAVINNGTLHYPDDLRVRSEGTGE